MAELIKSEENSKESNSTETSKPRGRPRDIFSHIFQHDDPLRNPKGGHVTKAHLNKKISYFLYRHRTSIQTSPEIFQEILKLKKKVHKSEHEKIIFSPDVFTFLIHYLNRSPTHDCLQELNLLKCSNDLTCTSSKCSETLTRLAQYLEYVDGSNFALRALD